MRIAAVCLLVIAAGCQDGAKRTGREPPIAGAQKADAVAEPPVVEAKKTDAVAAKPTATPAKADAAAKPLKVYILAGQSNMEGHARISTFDYIGLDPATAPILEEMRGADGKPRVCDDVWISYRTGDGEGFGKLTAGYGSRGNPAEPGDKIGPEFTFGIYMQKILDEPILIIKAAWGGKSLHTDFRSPSAGPYEFNEKQLEGYKKRGKDIEQVKADKAKATGHYYRQMMEHVKRVLSDIKRVCPIYDEKRGYEIAGFAWFQGWNDMCDGGTYPDRSKPGGYDTYSVNLAHFIRDVRKDLSAPDMRFVIGVMGVGAPGKQEIFRKAMAAPAAMPEFKGNVVAVQTSQFWDEALVAASAKRGKLNRILDTSDSINEDGRFDRNAREFPGWQAIGRPEPEERTWRYVSFDVRKESEKMPRSEGKRFRDVALPSGTEKWYAPAFDDGGWRQGKAPIGTGVWKHRRATVKSNSDWGDGEFLLMRTTFDLDALDCESYRLSILARQGFHVYLNGHRIHTYIWWKNEPYYRAIVLGENETKHLRKGENVLAAYANVHYDRKTGDPYASIDLFIEGITREGRELRAKALEEVFSPRDKAIADGASNAGYHSMGSGKIMAQIGKAFAEAMAK
ncbi:MAG: sialate O-acetylesterase [Planctomycetota bacterium]|jgi:alpha-galactosidase